jgi:peptide/nickel transport system permease protein
VASEKEIEYLLEVVDSLQAETPVLQDSMGQQLLAIKTSFAAVRQNASPWKCYIPTVHFHGIHNQFHVWLSGLMHLDFGRSYQAPRRQVKEMILEAMPVTIFMGFFSFTFAYLIAIPVGVYAVKKRNQWQDGAASVTLFMMHSIPTFVAAMLAMTFLCNPDYLQIFPTSGINSDGAEQWPFMSRMLDFVVHLTLPTLLFSYHSITFMSRQMRGSMLDTVNHDFIRTARAKGLSENTVIWRHAIRNSLLPIITQMAGLFPAIVSGGLITEFIFSIPGMGLLTTNALGSYDHPVILAIFTLTAIATLFGVLVADILYAIADPRISYSSK